MKERTMPVCLTSAQHKMIEEMAKQKGMLSSSQLIEELLNEG